MTLATFNEIQNRYKGIVLDNRNHLANLMNGLKHHYRFSCENFGNTSAQAGYFDRILCALQTAIEALDTVESAEVPIAE